MRAQTLLTHVLFLALTAIPAFAMTGSHFNLPYATELKDVYQLDNLPSGYREGEDVCATLLSASSSTMLGEIRALHSLADRMLKGTSAQATELVEPFVQTAKLILDEPLGDFEYNGYATAHMIEIYVISEKIRAANLRFGETNQAIIRAHYAITSQLDYIMQDSVPNIPKDKLKYWNAVRARVQSDMILARAGHPIHNFEMIELKSDLEDLKKLIKQLRAQSMPGFDKLFNETRAKAYELIAQKHITARKGRGGPGIF